MTLEKQKSTRKTRRIPIETRFWKYVKKTDTCWLWLGSIKDSGYGQLQSGDRTPLLAHRLSWEIHNGPIPDGLWVLHNCPDGDNRACVNPDHLFLGNNTDNMRDMSAKGRCQHGEQSPLSKLTEKQVIEIRSRYASGGISQAKLAKEYGVGQHAVFRIIHGQSWKHSP